MAERGDRGALFVTFEGGEGSGKTTQIAYAAAFLRAAGRSVVTTREPGGSLGADLLREILLSGKARSLGEEGEALLFAAARLDHLQTLVRPALERGDVVVCDRFHDSTSVYQGLAQSIGKRFLDRLEDATLDGLVPDLTILLDLSPVEGLRRAAARRGTAVVDRFEADKLEIHEQRRLAFLAIAEAEPKRVRVVDAARTTEAVRDEIAAILAERIASGEPSHTEGGTR